MSLSRCLEESLLHTLAHTPSDLRHIEQLKKNGIDYNSHASYRFVEK